MQNYKVYEQVLPGHTRGWKAVGLNLFGGPIDARGFRSALIQAYAFDLLSAGLANEQNVITLQHSLPPISHVMSDDRLTVPPDGELELGNAVTHAELAAWFAPSADCTIKCIRIAVKKNGASTLGESLTASIFSGAAYPGDPAAVVGQATGVATDDIPGTNWSIVQMEFLSGVNLTAGSDYWVHLDHTWADSDVNNISVGTMTVAAGAQRCRTRTAAGVWSTLALKNVWCQVDYLTFADVAAGIAPPVTLDQNTNSWALFGETSGTIAVDIEDINPILRLKTAPTGGAWAPLNRCILADPVITPHDLSGVRVDDTLRGALQPNLTPLYGG